MVSDKRILIDGFGWPPDALLERLRSPELPVEEFWRCMSYALYVMKDDEDYHDILFNQLFKFKLKGRFKDNKTKPYSPK